MLIIIVKIITRVCVCLTAEEALLHRRLVHARYELVVLARHQRVHVEEEVVFIFVEALEVVLVQYHLFAERRESVITIMPPDVLSIRERGNSCAVVYSFSCV